MSGVALNLSKSTIEAIGDATCPRRNGQMEFRSFLGSARASRAGFEALAETHVDSLRLFFSKYCKSVAVKSGCKKSIPLLTSPLARAIGDARALPRQRQAHQRRDDASPGDKGAT